MSKSAAKAPKKTIIEKLIKLRKKIGALATLDEANSLHIAVKIYCLALLLGADTDKWQKFCEHSDWRGNKSAPQPKPKSSKNALRFAIRFAVGFKDEANGNRVRKLQDLLNAAWEKGTKTAEIEAHIKDVQEAQRLKATERRAKRRITGSRSITLLHSEVSQLLMEKAGDYKLKGEFTISGAGSRRTSVRITSISKKSYKKLGVVKPATAKPASK